MPNEKIRVFSNTEFTIATHYTYQHSIIMLYMALGHPGGGGSLCPSLIKAITYKRILLLMRNMHTH